MDQAPGEWQENLQVRLICSDCRVDPPDLVEDHASGDLICGLCGLVLQQRSIDTSSEWRTFSNDDTGNDDPSRVGDGPNALLDGAQLNTQIAFSDGGMRSRELHRAQNRSTLDKANKNLLKAYKELATFCEGWQLPNAVVDTAKHIYKEAHDARAFKGKSMEPLIAGCIFLACRRHGVPRSFNEVYSLTKVSKKEIGRSFKDLEKLLKNKESTNPPGATSMVAGGTIVYNEPYKGTTTADPADLCSRFCNLLQMDMRAQNVAIDLAHGAARVGVLAGRSPLSTAAACIFMAGHLMDQVKSAKEISAVANVSDSTIRTAYKMLWAVRGKVISEEILARGALEERLPKPA